MIRALTFLPGQIALSQRHTPPKANNNLPQAVAAQNARLHSFGLLVVLLVGILELSKESLHNDIVGAGQ